MWTALQKGKTMNNGLKVDWRKPGEIPIAMNGVAEKRVRDMIDFYGRFIRNITIETLCASCYLQGVEDAMTVAIQEIPKLTREPELVLNFEI